MTDGRLVDSVADVDVVDIDRAGSVSALAGICVENPRFRSGTWRYMFDGVSPSISMEEGESGQSFSLPLSLSILFERSISEKMSPASLIGLGNRRRRHQLDSFVFCVVGVRVALVVSRDESAIKSLFMFNVK